MGFTRNYKNVLWTTITNSYQQWYNGFSDQYTSSFKDVSGNVRIFQSSSYYSDSGRTPILGIGGNKKNGYSSSASSDGWALGTGGTTFSIDDYKLENEITSELTKISNPTITYQLTDNYNIMKVTVNLYVSHSTGATIREVGWKSIISFGSSSGNQAAALMFREVLNTPVVLEAGKATQITLEFEVPNPVPTT